VQSSFTECRNRKLKEVASVRVAVRDVCENRTPQYVHGVAAGAAAFDFHKDLALSVSCTSNF